MCIIDGCETRGYLNFPGCDVGIYCSSCAENLKIKDLLKDVRKYFFDLF